MKQLTVITRRMRRIALPGLLFALTFCTLLTSGGFLVAYWRMMHLQHEQHMETLHDVRVFHKLLLSDLQKLVHQSTPQATEDLCQVRFRLREENGWGYPTGRFTLDLSAVHDGRANHLFRLETELTQGPIADFGLLAPGEYRLDIANSIGMTCRHDFRVIPGVPVDRAILCPHHTAPGEFRKVVPLSLELPWPAEWKSLPIVAVYHLEARRRKLGRWEWLPSQKQQFRRWVVRGHVPGSSLEDRLCQALPETLFAHPLPPTIEGPDAGTIQIPFYQCQLTAISFVLEQTPQQSPPMYLGSYSFFDGEDSPTPPPFFGSQNITLVPHPMPHWEYHKHEPTRWEIRLPRQIVRQIVDRVERELRKDQSANRGPISELPVHLRPLLDALSS